MKQFEKNTQFWLRPLSLPNGIPIVFVPLSQLQPPLTLDSLTQPSAFIASTSSTQRISSQFSFSLELNYGIFDLLKYMCKNMNMNSVNCPRNVYLDIYIYILYYKSANAATVLRYCTLRVFILCKHCSGNSTLVKHFFFFFNLLFKFCTEATGLALQLQQLLFFFFLFFRLYFFLIYCYTDTINFIIFS